MNISKQHRQNWVLMTYYVAYVMEDFAVEVSTIHEFKTPNSQVNMSLFTQAGKHCSSTISSGASSCYMQPRLEGHWLPIKHRKVGIVPHRLLCPICFGLLMPSSLWMQKRQFRLTAREQFPLQCRMTLEEGPVAARIYNVKVMVSRCLSDSEPLTSSGVVLTPITYIKF